jgi:ankyrin repeat protein
MLLACGPIPTWNGALGTDQAVSEGQGRSEALVRKGARLTAVNDQGRTALMLALFNGGIGDRQDAAGCWRRSQCHESRRITALSLAVTERRVELAELLLTYRADRPAARTGRCRSRGGGDAAW